MADKKFDFDFNIADYETVQKEKQRERQQKQLSEQQFKQMRKDAVREVKDAVNTLVGDSPQGKAVAAAAAAGIKYGEIAAKQGKKEAFKQAKRDGIDLGLKEFNKYLNESVNFFGIVTELKRMRDPKRFREDKISPVVSYEYEGKQGGFGAEYNPLYETGRVSGGMKLGPGRLTGEATVSPYGKSVGARFTTKFNKGGKVYNKRGQPRKVKY